MNEPTGKRCTKCGEAKPLTEFNRNRSRPDGLASWCRDCQRGDSRDWRAGNLEASRTYAREYQRARRADKPEVVRAEKRQHYKVNPDPQRDRSRRSKEAVRAKVLNHYGHACACCGASENLTIDHIDGGGEVHRAELGLGRGGTEFYRWLIANSFPDGFQVLCMPCNSSKNNGAACRLNHPAAVGVTNTGP